MPNDQPAATVPTVGVIGLGDIGGGVATSVLRQGLPLVVCDVRSEVTDRYAGRAEVAASPADLVGRSDVVVVAVVNDEQVHAVLSGPDGGLAAAGPDTIVIVVSTISTPCVQAIGDPTVVERAGPVFAAISSLAVTMGPFGCGLAAKLARNLITYGSWLAAHEGEQLAEAAGISLPKLAEVVKASDVHIGGASRLMFRPTVAPFSDQDDRGLVGIHPAARTSKEAPARRGSSGRHGASRPASEASTMPVTSSTMSGGTSSRESRSHSAVRSTTRASSRQSSGSGPPASR